MLEILRWTATFTGIAAAVMISLNAGARVTGWGFVIFIICSISWSTVGFVDDEPGLMLQNVVLTAINILGVYRYLYRKAGQPEVAAKTAA